MSLVNKPPNHSKSAFETNEFVAGAIKAKFDECVSDHRSGMSQSESHLHFHLASNFPGDQKLFIALGSLRSSMTTTSPLNDNKSIAKPTTSI